MNLTISHEIRSRYHDDKERLDDITTCTEMAFVVCQRMGLLSHQNIQPQSYQIRVHSEMLLPLLRAHPPRIDVNATDSQTGETLLHVLAQCFFPPISVVAAVIEAGAPLHAARTDNGETPLHVALHHMHHSLHQLAHDPDAVAKHYQTQLGHGGTHSSIARNARFHNGQRGLVSMAELLLCYGASLTHPNDQGKHAMNGYVSLEDAPEVSALVHLFADHGEQTMTDAIASGFQSITPNQLLQCANVGRLGECFSHPNWPYNATESLDMLRQLAPTFLSEHAGEIRALAAKEPPNTQINQWKIEPKSLPKRTLERP